MRAWVIGCALVSVLSTDVRAEPSRLRIGGSFGGGVAAEGIESNSQIGGDLEVGWRMPHAMLVATAGRYGFRADLDAPYVKAMRYALGVRVPFESILLHPEGSKLQLWAEIGAERTRFELRQRDGFTASVGMDTLIRFNPRTETRLSLGIAFRISFVEPIDDDRRFDPGFFMAAVRLGWEGR